MSNDLQAQISTRIGNTVSEIGKVNTAVTQLHASTERNNQAHKRFQDSASNAFKTAHRHASTFNDKMKDVGHAMGLLGGEAGHLSHMFSSMGRMSEHGGATIGRLAAAAGVAAVAFEAYSAVIERNIKNLKEAQEAEENYREAVIKGQDAKARNATAGLAGADSAGKLLGAGGPLALKGADYIADRDHIDVEDARKGVLKSYNIKDMKTRKAALEAASLFYQSGAGTFEEGVDAGVKDPAVRAALRSGDPTRAAALAREKTLTGRFRGGDKGALNDAIQNNAHDSLVQAKRAEIDDANGVKHNQENAARHGGARVQSKKELAESAAPEAAVMAEMGKTLQKQLDKQQEIADAQPLLIAAINNLGMLFGGEGSETQKQHRMQQANQAGADRATGQHAVTVNTGSAARHKGGVNYITSKPRAKKP